MRNKVLKSETIGTVEVILTTTTKRKEKVIDPDIKALYLITEALRISTPRMRKENLNFALGKYKLKVF